MIELKHLTSKDIERIFGSRPKRSAKTREETRAFISEILIRKYKYVPLSTEIDLQHTLNIIKEKKDPINALKEVALIIVSGSELKYSDEVREFVELCRWSVRVLGSPLKSPSYLAFLLAQAVRAYIDSRNELKAIKILAKYMEPETRLGFRRGKGQGGYKENAKLVDILYATGYAMKTPDPHFIFSLISSTSYENERKFPWKLMSGAVLAHLIGVLEARVRAFPERWISPEIAWPAIEASFKAREWIVSEYLRKSDISPYEVLMGAEKVLVEELVNEGLRRETVETIRKFIAPALLEESLLVPFYLAYYKVRPLNLIRALAEMNFTDK